MSQKPHDRTLAIDRSSLDTGRFRKEHAALAERVRGAIEEHPFTLDDATLRITISIGIAACPAHGRDIVSLVRRADLALYRAKEGGRNRTCVETED